MLMIFKLPLQTGNVIYSLGKFPSSVRYREMEYAVYTLSHFLGYLLFRLYHTFSLGSKGLRKK